MYFEDLNSHGMIGAQTSDWLKSIGLKCFPGVKRKPEYFSIPTVECDCKSFSHFITQHDASGSWRISQNSYIVHWLMQRLKIEEFKMSSVDCQDWNNISYYCISLYLTSRNKIVYISFVTPYIYFRYVIVPFCGSCTVHPRVNISSFFNLFPLNQLFVWTLRFKNRLLLPTFAKF